MNDLFRSEWRRFSRLSLIVALCHGLALFLMSRVVDVSNRPVDAYPVANGDRALPFTNSSECMRLRGLKRASPKENGLLVTWPSGVTDFSSPFSM